MCIVYEICPAWLKSRQILCVGILCDCATFEINKMRCQCRFKQSEIRCIDLTEGRRRLFQLSVLAVSIGMSNWANSSLEPMDVRSENVPSQKVLKLLIQPGAMSHMLTWLEDNDYQGRLTQRQFTVVWIQYAVFLNLTLCCLNKIVTSRHLRSVAI